MAVRIYKFEKNAESDILPRGVSVSAAAGEALAAAINGQPIFCEELTEPGNARPIVAVVFADPLSVQHFDSLIEATLELSGIQACEVRDLEPHSLLGLGRSAKAGSANDAGTPRRVTQAA